MTLPVQHIEGKYEVLQKMREGGMGAIYKVRHLLLDEVRVMKVMRPQLASDQDLRARFSREARMAIRVRHAHIAQLYDFSMDEDGTAIIVMEFIDGVTLQEILASGAPPSVALTIELARQTLQALDCLHRNGIVHRDISSDNLMVTRDFDGGALVKLIDLGLAKDAGAGTSCTAAQTFMGKARYSAPEQFEAGGASLLGPRSDLYSFGVVLYELLTGRFPFAGDSFGELVSGHLFRPPLTFEESDPGCRIPAPLRRTVLQALEKQPDLRIATADEFMEAIRPFAEPIDHAEVADLLRRGQMPAVVPAGPQARATLSAEELEQAQREAQIEQAVNQVSEILRRGAPAPVPREVLEVIEEELERHSQPRPKPKREDVPRFVPPSQPAPRARLSKTRRNIALALAAAGLVAAVPLSVWLFREDTAAVSEGSRHILDLPEESLDQLDLKLAAIGSELGGAGSAWSAELEQEGERVRRRRDLRARVEGGGDERETAKQLLELHRRLYRLVLRRRSTAAQPLARGPEAETEIGMLWESLRQPYLDLEADPEAQWVWARALGEIELLAEMLDSERLRERVIAERRGS